MLHFVQIRLQYVIERSYMYFGVGIDIGMYYTIINMASCSYSHTGVIT